MDAQAYLEVLPLRACDGLAFFVVSPRGKISEELSNCQSCDLPHVFSRISGACRVPTNGIQEHHLVGGLEHFLFFHILGIMIPTDELIFFRGVGQPPTSHVGGDNQVGTKIPV